MRAAVVIRCVAICVLATVASVAAQPRGRDGDPTFDRREAVKKKIRVLRAATLTDELNLDEKTLARLLPVLAKWDDVTEDLVKKRFDLQRRLFAAGASTDSKGVDRLIDDAVANQRLFWDLEDKRLVELRRILTPAQTARLLVVLPAFERRIHNQLRAALDRRGPDRNLADDDDFDAGGPPRPPRR